MTSEEVHGLLTSRDAGPVDIVNRDGRGGFLLLGDHAGNAVPEQLEGLGLSKAEMRSHIALDLGIAEIGRLLARGLDAPFAAQRYSRLVIDCNRALSDDEAIVPMSDGVIIAGNSSLQPAEREARAEAIYRPYHRAIADLLDERRLRNRPTILVSLHSFTPTLAGDARPWHIGVLYGGGDERFATEVLQALRREGGLSVGDNQPYQFDDTDFTVPYHAIAARLPYVEIELRQDQIATSDQQAHWAALLAQVLTCAAQKTGTHSASAQ